MPTPIDNTFTSYHLDPREDLEGCAFNMVQLAKLRNRLSTAAQLKLNLAVEERNERDFFNQHAYYSGQIYVLQLMIDESESAIRELASLSRL